MTQADFTQVAQGDFYDFDPAKGVWGGQHNGLALIHGIMNDDKSLKFRTHIFIMSFFSPIHFRLVASLSTNKTIENVLRCAFEVFLLKRPLIIALSIFDTIMN